MAGFSTASSSSTTTTTRRWGRTWKPIQSYCKNTSILSLAFVALLCTAAYFLAFWQSRGTVLSPLRSSSLSCNISSSFSFSFSSTNTTLDFAAHHTAPADSETAAAPPFPPCAAEFTEYTPCEGRPAALQFPRERLEYRERHCPAKAELLRCLVPAPPGYKLPLRWPASRDRAWFANVPHKELAVEKGGQNWIKAEGDMFRFPGGGTMFRRGADAYIDELGRMIPLGDGSIRTAVDTGCGVASLGAYLLPRNIQAMSLAPRDTHEAQVQFALERGVPAMLGILATIRLPYPSRAFDMAHCSRCLVPWHLYDGAYLVEVDRILRPGGYWILSGPPINWKQHWKGWKRTMEDLNAEQSAIEAVAGSLCWKKVAERGDIAIWQKPLNHMHCRTTREFCSPQDADAAWYTKMGACISRLPEVLGEGEVAGGELRKWPERLMALPPRIASGSVGGVTPVMFYEDAEMWKRRVGYYKTAIDQLGKKGRYRNLLDMNTGLGGFAAALVDDDDPVWVMNVVPTIAKADTLGLVYERGLIGTYQDWCEAMSTYPRTYDLIHADSVFSLYGDRCEMEDILLEMDRILRPEGTVIIRDDVDVLVRIKSITDRMRWDSHIADHEDGPLQREKLLLVVKAYWTVSAQIQGQTTGAAN